MAKYKYIDTQPRLIAVDRSRQLLPGTLEYALNHLLDHDVDLAHFDARSRNDVTGAPAYPPALLLKVVLFAYSQGIVSSRAIERVCQDHVTFIALWGDHAPHFTTIARFVSPLGEAIAQVFAAVLAVGDQQGLIGREMFAIDGGKLPSNASKHRSGTRAEFERHATKMEAAAASSPPMPAITANRTSWNSPHGRSRRSSLIRTCETGMRASRRKADTRRAPIRCPTKQA